MIDPAQSAPLTSIVRVHPQPNSASLLPPIALAAAVVLLGLLIIGSCMP